jgi:hypothetical protein
MDRDPGVGKLQAKVQDCIYNWLLWSSELWRRIVLYVAANISEDGGDMCRGNNSTSNWAIYVCITVNITWSKYLI